MITEDYVSFEVAKLLKEKGFNEPCMAYYTTSTHKGHEVHYDVHNPCNSDLNIIFCNMEFGSLPTHQMVMKWLREEYGIFIEISTLKRYRWVYTIYKLFEEKITEVWNDGTYVSYEDAVEAALKYSLEKQCEKTNPYSGISFEYNGHIWGMCARDNGVDILLDKQLFKHLEKQDEQKEINLVEILKHYPKETELYSPLYGKLWLAEVDEKNEIITCYKHHLEEGCTRTVLEQEDTISFYSNGTTGLPDFNVSKDCMLFLYDIVKRGEQKSADTVKPKFHEGDWVISNLDEKARQISEVHFDKYNSYYVVNGKSVNLEEYDRLHHLWTIQDAKDGDVLWHSDTASHGTFIFKQIRYDGKVLCYCDYDSEDHFCTGEHHTCCWSSDKCIKPATNEQRELLFQKMHEAGYTFDFEKKELKKIEPKTEENKGNVGGISSNWSEEDSQYVEDTLALIGFGLSTHTIGQVQEWLHSLQDRVQPQPKQEWNEDDEEALEMAIIALEDMYDDDTPSTTYGGHYMPFDKAAKWLKSLQDRVLPQPKQEWSEEDEKRIKKVMHILSLDGRISNKELKSILDWLKSLRPLNTYNPYKAVVESIAEMCKHYDKASHSGLRDFYDNVKVKCKDAKQYDKMFPQAQWKPSDEQMEALKAMTRYCEIATSFDAHKQRIVESLRSELKKLKEE